MIMAERLDTVGAEWTTCQKHPVRFTAHASSRLLNAFFPGERNGELFTVL